MKVLKKDVEEYVALAMRFWTMNERDVDALIETAQKKHKTACRIFGENEELPGCIDDQVILNELVTVEEVCKLLRDKGVEVVDDGDV